MLVEPYNNKKLINLDKIRDKVFDDFKKNKLHHSLIFVGERGIGKSTLCYHIANKILSSDSTLKKEAPISLFEEPVKDDELSDDDPTFNLIKNKKHPDLLVIEKEIGLKKSKFNTDIKVASARKILDFMILSPFVSKNKIVIIDSIDEMNISAQNAILKVLEEPFDNTFIFLVCNNLSVVLDTIKSRCREIGVFTPKISEWIDILKYVNKDGFEKLEKSQINELYELSNGSISKAINIIECDGFFLYRNIQNILSDKTFNVENIQNLAYKLNDNEKLFFLFSEFIILFLYKILKYLSINEGDVFFKENNTNFILKNNKEKILKKIKFTQNLLRDVRKLNLNKKHSIVVLLTELLR